MLSGIRDLNTYQEVISVTLLDKNKDFNAH